MSKFFTVMLSVLLLVAVAVPALATDARQQALAGTGNYIEDDYNIFTWYATLPSYSNTIWIGLNYYNYYYDAAVTTSNQVGAQPLANNYAYMGASYGLGKEGKYGTLAMFYTDSSPGLNMFWGNWSGASVFSESADQKWTVMYAYPMEKMSIGLMFNRADWSYKNEDRTSTTEEHYLSYTTFGAGVRFDMGEKDYIDLAADLSLASYKDHGDYYSYATYGVVTNDASTMFDIRARMFHQCNETMTWVPYIEYGSFNFSLKADKAVAWKDDFYGDKGYMVRFGLGANLKINENNLLIFAIEPYSYGKVEPADPPVGTTLSYTETYLPTFRLAYEADVKDWLTYRGGCYKEFYKEVQKSSTETAANTTTWTGSYFNYYMGLGFHVGSFDIDALINTDTPFKLGYWLTGYSSWNNYGGDVPIYTISTTYKF